MNMDRTDAIIGLLVILILAVGVAGVELYRLNQSIGPIASSTLVRTLSSV